MGDGLRGMARLWRATRVSYQGLAWALREEEAFRLEFALCVVLVPMALWLGHDGPQRAIMILSLFVVLITELLNTAVEAVVDRVGLEHHVLSGRAKDLASAAVHLSLVQVPVVWGLIIHSNWN